MAITVIQQEELSRAPQFLARMRVLTCAYAKTVATAAFGGVITAASKDLAARVQSDPLTMAGKIAVSFVSDNAIKSNTVTGAGATLDTDRTDAQLAQAIQTAWDAKTWDNVV